MASDVMVYVPNFFILGSGFSVGVTDGGGFMSSVKMASDDVIFIQSSKGIS
jgi:hypothetical protein